MPHPCVAMPPLTPEDIAAMAADPEIAALLPLLLDPKRAMIELDREIVAREGLRGFIRLAWPILEREGTYRSNWHIDAICEHLEAVSSGEIKRLAIALPPRHMKSLMCSVFWPAWDWIDNPWRRFLFSSYAQNLSTRDSVKCRNVVRSPWFRARWGDSFSLASDQKTKIRFENSRGGVRLSTSVGGQLTGEGGDIVCCDDANNVKKVESDAIREGTQIWWSESMSTRLNDPKSGAFVLIQQRVHERDLTGYVLEREGTVDKGGLWTYLCLPAEFERDHPYRWVFDPRKNDGDLLWPTHMPRRTLRALATALGSYAAAGQLQQRPAPREGGMFKRHWFKPIATAAADTKWMRSWDPAATEKELVKSDPDYTAGALVGFSETRGKWIIAHMDRFRVNPGELYARIKARAAGDTATVGYHKIIYPQDPAQAGKDQAAAIAVLLTGYAFEIRPVSGEKVVRATPFSSQAEMGNVEILYAQGAGADNTWQEPFLAEISSFPTAAHDDQVDAVASGFNALCGGTQGLLDYYKNKLATNAARDAATTAGAEAAKHIVSPDVPMHIHTETTTNLARAYLGARLLKPDCRPQ